MASWREERQGVTWTNWLVLIGIAIAAGFAGLCGKILLEMRDKDYEHARQASANLIATVASDIDRNIELYDLSLQAVIDGLKLPGINGVNRELRAALLFDRSTTAKELGAILVIDRNGDLVIDSRSHEPKPANYADRDFFKAQVHAADDGLFISRPWMGPDGQYLMSFSRRIANADGSFGGVVAGSMRLAYFYGLSKKLKLGPQDTLTLIHTDGTVLMRVPYDNDAIGRDLSKTSIFEHMQNARSGAYDIVSLFDGVPRLIVYQQVADRPLVIVAGNALDSVFAGWQHEMHLIGALVLVLCLLMTALFGLLGHALKRRSCAEQKLAAIASTDALTGLSNRRRFEEMLESVWRRAHRQKSPVSLIMIDADCFKAYNDTHGHQAGDTALASIAQCIANGPREGAEFAARYGGEEFAVLLPNHTIEGALAVAEEIRSSVLSLRAQQQGRPDATPTVSAGVACMVPLPGLMPQNLVKSADLALYEAKRQGRNRSVTSSLGVTLRSMKIAA
jgi:diguanylate cyclase (GGDEF)-like protein